MTEPLRVLNLITALTTGGAEMMLLRLLQVVDRARFEPLVVALSPGGAMVPRLQAAGLRLADLGLPRSLPDPRGALRLARLLRRERIDVVQSWMYHADLLGSLVAGRHGVPVAWGIHNSALDPRRAKRLTRLVRAACARLSWRWPRAVVCCSQAARRVHCEVGYNPAVMRVIPNGFDVQTWRPQPALRPVQRAQLGVPAEVPLVSLVARFDADKDQATFLAAAARVAAALPAVRFVMCGRDILATNPVLGSWLQQHQLTDRVLLLGERDDLPELLQAVDLACSSSASEAMPLAVGEAMACGLPCVVTDVGDSAPMVGDTGLVAPPQDPAALAAAMLQLLREPAAARQARGAAARQRIATQYSLDAIATQYQQLWAQLHAERAVAS
ncbi:MAG: glycosyltransferase [Fimbriimonadaceae bacterium]|nr:glycosyltransferase [Fimbriimonadaceae bacterium]